MHLGKYDERFMINHIRKIYNRIDSLFDRAAITEKIQLTRETSGVDQPVTAGLAFGNVLPVARGFDRKAILKLITSPQGVDQHGNSTHWEFFFDLVQRRAQLAAEWKMTWDEKTDRHGPVQIAITVNPFPPVDSPIRRMVGDGQLLHKQMIGMWKQELRRRSALPHSFRDTNMVIVELVKQGLDITITEFSLHTGMSPKGQPNWIAQTRDGSHLVPFV
jgi:hypothetical protein